MTTRPQVSTFTSLNSMTDQYQLTSIFCARPQQFAWFLGAGTSAVAGLPTAVDVIWYLKLRYYCREENQKLSREDLQIAAVRERIQAFMLSRGFPPEGDLREYTEYFEKAFGDDKERQRQFLSALLSEKNVTLSVGNRVLGALLAMGSARAVFGTNFDTVVERAVAEVSGKSLTTFHLEGAASANKAISNEEFPIYCKLHGDFRYDSVKNLAADLANQNADLGKAFLNAANRFGFIVAGYSGRDESVMTLLRSALSTSNPFPHGLFWTVMKGATILPVVQHLIDEARQKGVEATIIEVETFDAFMLRLWRNLDTKDAVLDAKVHKSHQTAVSIPLPGPGRGPTMRVNALPILEVPKQCQALTLTTTREWSDLRAITGASEGALLFTKADKVLCWGAEAIVREQFSDLLGIDVHELLPELGDIGRHLHIKGFIEDALCRSLARDKPLLSRTTRTASFLIVDPHHDDQSAFGNLHQAVGKIAGPITGLIAAADEHHPEPQKVYWAEALRVSVEFVDGKVWLLLDPDVWIWPARARKEATAFLDERRGDRYNKTYNALIEAWLDVLLGNGDWPNAVSFSAFDGGAPSETPTFVIGTKLASSRGRA